jgi:outer membrane protein TolC
VLASAEQRLNVGLATRPEMLLAKQVEVRAVYELENAKVAVKNAEAELALTLGIAANRPVTIESMQEQARPTDLDSAVDSLIDTALEQRPDLAARVAALENPQDANHQPIPELWDGHASERILDVLELKLDRA